MNNFVIFLLIRCLSFLSDRIAVNNLDSPFSVSICNVHKKKYFWIISYVN